MLKILAISWITTLERKVAQRLCLPRKRVPPAPALRVCPKARRRRQLQSTAVKNTYRTSRGKGTARENAARAVGRPWRDKARARGTHASHMHILLLLIYLFHTSLALRICYLRSLARGSAIHHFPLSSHSESAFKFSASSYLIS